MCEVVEPQRKVVIYLVLYTPVGSTGVLLCLCVRVCGHYVFRFIFACRVDHHSCCRKSEERVCCCPAILIYLLNLGT